MNNDTPISFFRGTTQDGFAFVVSVVGGPTATNPENAGHASGMISLPHNRGKDLPLMTARQGIALKNMLKDVDAIDYHQAVQNARQLYF